ncbi:hypothetical protein K0M31_014393 [Melipona bicolor]|uniref:Uncharacterized protein n=1 Tax=Melipona bicolor TaxID=60889 RepID=A0AA40G8Q4_9HYME|nr:hypothetical protein K0M31_014393 [Melipona bicolor]
MAIGKASSTMSDKCRLAGLGLTWHKKPIDLPIDIDKYQKKSALSSSSLSNILSL